MRDKFYNNLEDEEYESRKYRSQYQDISNVLKIDSKILNFSACLPSKMLGNKLIVANITDYE
jgi:hypothetical protein